MGPQERLIGSLKVFIYRGGREGGRRRKLPKASSEPPKASPEPPKGGGLFRRVFATVLGFDHVFKVFEHFMGLFVRFAYFTLPMDAPD